MQQLPYLDLVDIVDGLVELHRLLGLQDKHSRAESVWQHGMLDLEHTTTRSDTVR